jgi:hypothetical protein
MYAMHCTRPHISFLVCRLSRYTNNPSTKHWKAIGRVIGFLKRTIELGLYYTDYMKLRRPPHLHEAPSGQVSCAVQTRHVLLRYMYLYVLLFSSFFFLFFF